MEFPRRFADCVFLAEETHTCDVTGKVCDTPRDECIHYREGGELPRINWAGRKKGVYEHDAAEDLQEWRTED